jgi:hypothetical protein
MHFKKFFVPLLQLFSVGLLVLGAAGCADKKESGDAAEWSVTSPDQAVRAVVSFADGNSGRLQYRVFLNKNGRETEVVGASPLGIIRQDQAFDSALVLEEASQPKTIDENYTLAVGKRLDNRNHANEVTLAFKNAGNGRLNLVFRAYNDGVAFRYAFPGEDKKPYTVTRELTGFQLPAGGTGWLQPYDTASTYTPAYEKYFLNDVKVGTASPLAPGWCFPALFTADSSWVLLTEAGLQGNYFGAHLAAEAPGGLYTVRQPEEGEGLGTGSINATSTLPWEMPWRVIITGNSLRTIVESNLVHHLNPPSQIADASWVKPGRSSWSWWSDNASSKDFNKLKTFVDLAADMGWEYSLVDANWNIMTGGNLEGLAKYANGKGVGLLAWYNSGGPHNQVTEQPRDIMFDPQRRKTEMQKLQQMGVKGIKVDFFQSDKQPVIQEYFDILKDAADHQIMVNFHGCTIPRGWSRTWPNLVSMESVRGAESYIFAADYPEGTLLHNAILPFTRNVIGPMDYTPATFSNQKYPHLTTYAYELALPVVFESGITHLADRVAAYQGLPAAPKQFLKDVPAAWDETRFLSGYPGDDVVLARRRGDVWYVGGINGEKKAKTLPVDLSFLKDGDYQATVIADGKDAKSFASTTRSVTRTAKETVQVLPLGGFVMRIAAKGV